MGLPGGGLDYAEEPEVGLAREIKEECGVDILVKFPLAVKHTIWQKTIKIFIE